MNGLMTSAAVLLEDRTSRAYPLGDLVRLILLGPLDLVIYRPFIVWARLKGTWRYLRGDQGWHKFERNARPGHLAGRGTIARARRGDALIACAVEAVEHVVALSARRETRPGVGERLQVLREPGFGDRDQRGELLRRARLLGDESQGAEPRVVAERAQQLQQPRCPSIGFASRAMNRAG